MNIFQKGFNYSQDGPGNRLVYHLKGCNMHCPWCSNPEGMSTSVGTYTVMTPSELVSEAISSKPMFFDGGGVTFTGGEATQQPDELEEVLRGLSENGINTAIETNGTYHRLGELLCLIDHLMIDFKHPLSERHKRFTGLPNDAVKDNIRLAIAQGKDLLVRIPFIGGVNNDRESIDGFLDFFKSLDTDRFRVEILPYHEYGKDKWAKCGLTYTMENAFVSEDERTKFEQQLMAIGVAVIRT